MIALFSARNRGNENRVEREQMVRRGVELTVSGASKCALIALLMVGAITVSNAQTTAASAHDQHAFFHVGLSGSFAGPVSGRLLLFVAPPSGDGSTVDMNIMSLESVYIAAK